MILRKIVLAIEYLGFFKAGSLAKKTLVFTQQIMDSIYSNIYSSYETLCAK